MISNWSEQHPNAGQNIQHQGQPLTSIIALRKLFQAQEDLSKQLGVVKSMLYAAESSNAQAQTNDQQSDIVLAQLSQVMGHSLMTSPT